MSCSTLTELSQSNQKWQCCACRDTPANIPSLVTGLQTTSDERLRWGKVSLSEFEEQLISCYKEIVKWKKNLFMLPSGRAGKEFLTEMKRLVDLFINKTSFNHVALNALMVFGPLLLQKPSRSSKSSDHVKYLSKRLTLWKDGDLVTILGEARAIQKRFCKLQPKKDPDHARKVFVRLMLEGKVSSALRWLDSQCSRGSLEFNDSILQSLRSKHPPGQAPLSSDLLRGPLKKVESVLFDQIDAHAIYKAALSTKGSGGPTHLDSDAWQRFLCSKSFGNTCSDLCDSIARLVRMLCT